MGGGRLRELNHMGSLFREEVLTHLSFVFRLLRVVQYTQRIKRSDHVYSGRLQGVKINGNYCHPQKMSRSLSKGGRL